MARCRWDRSSGRSRGRYGRSIPAPASTTSYHAKPRRQRSQRLEPTGTEPTDSGTDQGAQAAIDEVAARCPRIRELEPKQECPIAEITQRQFRRRWRGSFDEENPTARVAAEETLLKRLGLLPQDADLRELMLDLYESQVAAFYDPETGDMTVIKRDGGLRARGAACSWRTSTTTHSRISTGT